MGTVGILFLTALFLISSRVLIYFQSVQILGDYLARELLGMVLLTLFSLLVFSHIISGLSNLYLSNDLEFCHSMPVPIHALFAARAIHTILDSSWMLFVFGLPVFMAYAYVYRPGFSFYPTLVFLNLAMMFIAGGLGILVIMALVSIFPANRTRDIVMLLSLLIGVLLYVIFRLLRPERLVDVNAFFSVAQYLSSLKGVDSPFLPTHWIATALWAELGHNERNSVLFNSALAWSTAGALAVFNLWAAGALYFDGFSKAREAKRRKGRKKFFLSVLDRLGSKSFGREIGAIMAKDVRVFFRDNTQWSQLLLLGALVVVYLYNFMALPLDKSPVRLVFLQNELAFLNMGLAGFVVSAVSARFVFPAVSGEGQAYWIIRSSPVTLKRLLWGKYCLFLIPMLLLTEILIISTNYLLNVSSMIMLLSSLTMFFVVLGVVAMGVGMGARYPDFKYENIAKLATGFGGLMYMMISALFIACVIILEAGPVYILFTSHLNEKVVSPLQWSFITGSFFSVLVISAIAVYKPMQIGLRHLRAYE